MKKLIYIIVCLCLGTAIVEPTSAQVDVQKSSRATKIGANYYFVHRVEKGQTIYSIARAYGVTEHDILKANDLKPGDAIKARSDLYVPFRSESKVEQKQVDTVENKVTESAQPIQGSTIAGFVTTKNTEPQKPHGIPEIKKITSEEVIIADTAQKERNIHSDFTINTCGDKIKGLFLLSDNGTNPNEKDLLNGAILAAEELQANGIDVSVEGVSDIGFGVSKNIGFIVAGKDVIKSAEELSINKRIPVIAPLVGVEKGAGLTMQFAPQNDGKYDKLKSLINNTDANVVIIHHSSYNDVEAQNEIATIVPSWVKTITYSRENRASSIAQNLSKEKENIIIVPVNHQGSVEDILSKITSLNSLKKDYDIKVIGTNRWKHLNNINPELLFKANVFYPTSYHWDRSSEKTANFFSKYIDRYDQIPNAFSMRGYDIVMIMGEAIAKWGSKALENMEGKEFTPLQTPYSFVGLVGDKMYNNDWVLVNMTPNYTIETK